MGRLRVLFGANSSLWGSGLVVVNQFENHFVEWHDLTACAAKFGLDNIQLVARVRPNGKADANRKLFAGVVHNISP